MAMPTFGKHFSDIPVCSPGKRVGHTSCKVGDEIILWAGSNPFLPQVHDNKKKREHLSLVHVFDIPSNKWRNEKTVGISPLGACSYFCTPVVSNIYYFGGWCYHDRCYHNSLFELKNDRCFRWKELSPTNRRHCVMSRGSSKMVSFQFNNESILMIIGGSGPTPLIKQPNVEYHEISNGFTSTNECNLFFLESKRWDSPKIVGHCMPACAGFIMEKISNTEAIVYGGLIVKGTQECSLSTDVYIVKLVGRNILQWERVQKDAGCWPIERRYHASSTYSIGSKQFLLVTSGQHKSVHINDCDVINDFWIFDIEEKEWTEITCDLPITMTQRYSHTVSVIKQTEHCVQLLAIGGYNDSSEACDDHIMVLIELKTCDEKVKELKQISTSSNSSTVNTTDKESRRSISISITLSPSRESFRISIDSESKNQKQANLPQSVELFRQSIPKLTEAISSNLVRISDILFSRNLIGDQQCDIVRGMDGATNYYKASEITHHMYKLLKRHEDPKQFLVEIIEIFIGIDELRNTATFMKENLL